MALKPLRHLVNRAQTGDREAIRQVDRQTGYHGYQSREKRMGGDEPECVCAFVCVAAEEPQADSHCVLVIQ